MLPHCETRVGRLYNVLFRACGSQNFLHHKLVLCSTIFPWTNGVTKYDICTSKLFYVLRSINTANVLQLV